MSTWLSQPYNGLKISANCVFMNTNILFLIECFGIPLIDMQEQIWKKQINLLRSKNWRHLYI